MSAAAPIVGIIIGWAALLVFGGMLIAAVRRLAIRWSQPSRLRHPGIPLHGGQAVLSGAERPRPQQRIPEPPPR